MTQSFEELIPSLTSWLESNQRHQEMLFLKDLAFQSANSIAGSIKKQMSSGQGTMPYIEALTSGTKYFMENAAILLGVELRDSVAERYFELAFEQVLSQFGDPYDPINLNFTDGPPPPDFG